MNPKQKTDGGHKTMCVLGQKEYPNFPAAPPWPTVTHRQLILFLVAPMSQGGTLPHEMVTHNIQKAVARAHAIETATGHIVIVPHLDLCHPPPRNGQPSWELLYTKHARLLQAACQGIIQLAYDVERDVECVGFVNWWHQHRASITIYREVTHIPRLCPL
ncbi:hypothetical protein HY523_00015 [Candidatus Berkelbacteria bacterium]|nr:hypothetical protein [Candidatus Berkelbacteria bacterium]